MIHSDEDKDDIFLGIEQTSGVNAQAKQRVQFNFVVTKDDLFNYTQNDYLIPLAFIQREALITKDQIRQMLGDLYTAKTARTAGICVFIIIGVLLLLLGAFMLYKAKKQKRLEQLGIADSYVAPG